MPLPYSTPYLLCRGLEEYPCTVHYSYTPGCPARGPSYSSGGEPADPPEIGDFRLTLDRTGWPMATTMQEDEELYEWLLDNHEEDDAWGDYAYEAWRDRDD